MVIMGKNMIYTRANWDTVILFSSNCLCDKSKEIEFLGILINSKEIIILLSQKMLQW